MDHGECILEKREGRVDAGECILKSVDWRSDYWIVYKGESISERV